MIGAPRRLSRCGQRRRCAVRQVGGGKPWKPKPRAANSVREAAKAKPRAAKSAREAAKSKPRAANSTRQAVAVETTSSEGSARGSEGETTSGELSAASRGSRNHEQRSQRERQRSRNHEQRSRSEKRRKRECKIRSTDPAAARADGAVPSHLPIPPKKPIVTSGSPPRHHKKCFIVRNQALPQSGKEQKNRESPRHFLGTNREKREIHPTTLRKHRKVANFPPS